MTDKQKKTLTAFLTAKPKNVLLTTLNNDSSHTIQEINNNRSTYNLKPNSDLEFKTVTSESGCIMKDDNSLVQNLKASSISSKSDQTVQIADKRLGSFEQTGSQKCATSENVAFL
jgi:hypothetical protein